jgi:hypothetical protein
MLLHGPEPRVDWRPLRSTLAYLQTDTDFASLIVGEVNAGLFSSVCAAWRRIFATGLLRELSCLDSSSLS